MFGRDTMVMKLQLPVLIGGLGLNEQDAEVAVSQLELINRVTAKKTEAVESETKLLEEENRRLRFGANADSIVAQTHALEEENAKLKQSLIDMQDELHGFRGEAPAEPAAAEDASGAAKPSDGAAKPPEEAPGPKKGSEKGAGKGQPPASPGELALGPVGGKDGAPAGKGAPAPAPGKGGGPPGKGGEQPGKGGDGKKGDGKGKKGAAGPTLNRPAIKTTEPMKNMQWTRFVIGDKIQKGDTIWDKVTDDWAHLVPAEEMEARFSKNAGKISVDKGPSEEKEKAKPKNITVVPDGSRMNIEVLLKGLPPADVSHKAILDLDEETLPVEWVRDINKYLCADDGQLAQMNQLQQETPELPLGSIEKYMMAMSAIPAVKMRLEAWEFVRGLPEQLEIYETQVTKFAAMVQCFTQSTVLPKLLGLVLNFGNYLNGGNTRLGQADGFNIEILGRPGGLDSMNDPKGKNIRQLLFKVFFDNCFDQAELLLQELQPLFVIVQRMMAKPANKDEGDDEKLQKLVRVQIEELDNQISTLAKDFAAKHAEMKLGLQQITDASDNFRMLMPEKFRDAENSLSAIVQAKDESLANFKSLLTSYVAEKYKGKEASEKMTSKVWVELWDDFFIARDLIENANGKIQKTHLLPRFCKEAPFDVEGLRILWGLVDPNPKPKRAAKAVAKKRNSITKLGKRGSVMPVKPPSLSRMGIPQSQK